MLFTNFPKNYEIIVNPELPGTGKWGISEVYIPNDFEPRALGGHLVLKVKTDQQWQVWHVESDDNSEIWTTPNPDWMLIAGMEQAFYISAKDPRDVVRLKRYNLHVTAVDEQNMLLLNDCFSVSALDGSGVRWQTPDLVDDDMTIKTVHGDIICCSGFSLGSIDEEVKILLDLSTGSVLREDKPRERKTYLHSMRNRLSNTIRRNRGQGR